MCKTNLYKFTINKLTSFSETVKNKRRYSAKLTFLLDSRYILPLTYTFLNLEVYQMHFKVYNISLDPKLSKKDSNLPKKLYFFLKLLTFLFILFLKCKV